MSKYTPGPWRYVPGTAPKVIAENSLIICTTQSCNANLIAAAPDMISVLERLKKHYEGDELELLDTDPLDLINEVVSKAKGEL